MSQNQNSLIQKMAKENPAQRLENMNDAELLSYWDQAKAQGYSLDQLKTLARAQGASSSDIAQFEKRIKNLDLNIFQLSIIFNQKLSDEMFNKILIILNKNSKEVDFTSMSSVTKETSVHFEIFPNSAKSISIINKELNKQVKSSKVIFSRKENISL